MSDEEYEFEYSDEEEEVQQDDVAIQIENKYYGSKGMLGGAGADVDGAQQGFLEVVELARSKADGSLAEWGFKATKQLVKLSFRRGAYDKMLAYYTDLLQRIKAGAVTRNRAEKTINSILDLVSSASEASHLSSFYDTTLVALAEGGGNERLAFKTRTKQARLYLANKDWARLKPLLASLYSACSAASSAGGASAGAGAGAGSSSAAASGDMATQLLEVLALQVQMYSEQRDTKRVAELVAKASAVKSAVPHPGIIGVLKEAAGKVAMRDRAWEAARLAFQESFKAFEEAGNGARTTANLQYMLLANMLSNNRINPFDDQSSKAHERDPAIASMVALTDAYLAGDIAAFEPVLRAAAGGGQQQGGAGAGAGRGPAAPAPALGGGMDEFMLGYVNDLLSTMRTGVALVLVQPYDRVRLEWLGQELGVSAAEAEILVAGLILDGRLVGSIDQPARVLNLGQQHRAPGVAVEAKASAGGGAKPGAAAASSTYHELMSLANRLERLAGTAGQLTNKEARGAGAYGPQSYAEFI